MYRFAFTEWTRIRARVQTPFQMLLLLVSVMAAAAAVALFVWHVHRVWAFTVDDAFITFRYAHNLASGDGPTFNPGESRAEGYTSFLWMAITALPHALGFGPVVFSKLFGIGAFALAAAVAGAVAWGVRSRHLVAGVAAVAVSLYLVLAPPATAIHAVSGMETGLFTLALTCLLALASLGRGGRLELYGLPVLALVCGLSRPEGNLAAILVLAVGLVLSRDLRRERCMAIVGFYVLPGAIYFAWRLLYYGVLFPLPFYVKVGSSGSLSGWPYVQEYRKAAGYPLLALAAVGAAALGRRSLPGLVACLALLAFFVVPEPLMGFNSRFLYPTWPYLAALAGAGTGVLALLAGRVGRFNPWLTGLLQAVVILGVLVSAADRSRRKEYEINAKLAYAHGLEHAHIGLGKKMGRVTAVPPPLVAIGDAGAVPYYSRWRVIDTFGLNEPTIALSKRRDAHWVMQREPDIVVLLSSSESELKALLPWETELFQQCSRSGMERIAVWTFLEGRYFLWVMGAPDGPLAAAVRPAAF